MALVPLMHFTWECWLKVMCNGGRRNLLLSVNSTLACSTQLDHSTENSHQRLPAEQQTAHPLISLLPLPGHEPTKRSRRCHSGYVKKITDRLNSSPFCFHFCMKRIKWIRNRTKTPVSPNLPKKLMISNKKSSASIIPNVQLLGATFWET
jgi:hypothetical protein